MKPHRRAIRFTAGVMAICTLCIGVAVAQAPAQSVKVMGWWSTLGVFKGGWEFTMKEFERRNPGVRIDYTARDKPCSGPDERARSTWYSSVFMTGLSITQGAIMHKE